ncbi:general secretion pathway protein L [Bordetella ansorpii]|uniref:General secretion pathway protein L n=1 Tax=Bordetella ansorpii TaxID=288768 RepID=A0A157SFZ7_9BORD|nr:type II secretion system protein GspL [Bordetella ansorpii]SAI69113.1 general secretion pathway protein L [Bordetella ansorpii]
MKKLSLRVALPALHAMRPDTVVSCAHVTRHGEVQFEGELPLRDIAARWPGQPVHFLLHPSDVALASVPVPPLSGARLDAAITTAAEPLVLGDLSSVVLAHGPRGDNGEAMLAWVEREALEQAMKRIADCKLKVAGCYPAPFFLPVSETGWTATLTGDSLLVRTGTDGAMVYPLPADVDMTTGQQPAELTFIAAEVQQAAPGAVAWIGACPAWWPLVSPAPCTLAPPSQRWAGALPGWSLNPSADKSVHSQDWREPLAWVAGAAVLWMLGLNLYAGRLANEGAALQQHMSQRVRTVFPELPTVLNPLQQSRQQRDARIAAQEQGAAGEFAALLRLSAQTLPFSSGEVRELRYVPGELTLQTRAAGAPAGQSEPAWVQEARKAGLTVESGEPSGNWRIRRATAQDGAIKPPTGPATAGTATAGDRS